MTERALNQLVVKGVGWRVERVAGASSEAGELVLYLGSPHIHRRAIPAGVEVRLSGGDKEGTRVHLSGGDARLLGNFSASLIRLRPFDPYTGQGIVRLDKGIPARKSGKRKG